MLLVLVAMVMFRGPPPYGPRPPRSPLMRGPFPPGMRSPQIITTSIIIIIIIIIIISIIIMMTIRPRHLVSPTLRGGGRGGRALAGLSPPPRPPLHLFRSPSPTHGQSSSYLFFSLTIPGLIRITPRHLPPSYRPRHPSPSHRPFPPSPLHR